MVASNARDVKVEKLIEGMVEVARAPTMHPTWRIKELLTAGATQLQVMLADLKGWEAEARGTAHAGWQGPKPGAYS